MTTHVSSPKRKRSLRRAFLPFWIALFLGTLIMGRDYHQRNAVLTRLKLKVTMDGKPPEEEFSFTVNGAAYNPFMPLPMGFREIGIRSPNYEPQTWSRFVWYGVTDLGGVNLVRSRGLAEAHILPVADSYELSGKGGRWTNPTGAFKDVPVGRYDLLLRFGSSLTETLGVEVRRNETTHVRYTAPIGALELKSEVPGVGFELIQLRTYDVLEGTVPSTLSRLKAGGYRLNAKLGNDVRQQTLEIKSNETNRVALKFDYATAEITSTPTGATVAINDIERGVTPLIVTNLVPGSYRLRVALAGYDVQESEGRADLARPSKREFKLVNRNYRVAMERARELMDRDDFQGAISALNTALEVQPGDEEAGSLIVRSRVQSARRRAIYLADRGEFEAALTELENALKAAPGDAEIVALQGKIRDAGVKSTQEKVEARFQETATEFRRLVGREDFTRALSLLEEAKKKFPDRKEIPEWEASVRKELSRLSQQAAEAKRKSALEAQVRRTKEAWERALSSERDAQRFPVRRWKTSKSGEEVLAVVQKLGRIDDAFRVSELTTDSTSVFTAKMGGLNQTSRELIYARIGVFDFGEGITHIRVMMLGYWFTENGPRPEPASERLEQRAERLRSTMAKYLGADVN